MNETVNTPRVALLQQFRAFTVEENMSRCIVTYHYVRNDRRYKVHALSKNDFIRQVDYFDRHMPAMDPHEMVDCLREGEKDVPDGYLLTFDDGLKEHYETVFPYLKEKKIKAIFFPNILPFIENKPPMVNQLQALIGELGPESLAKKVLIRLRAHDVHFDGSSAHMSPRVIKRMDNALVNNLKYYLNFTVPWNISQEIVNDIFEENICDNATYIKDNYLTIDQLREMHSSGMMIGGHTVTHPYLTSIDISRKRFEIATSIHYLEEIIGDPISTFVYPFGHHDKETINIMIESNIVAAFSTEPKDNVVPEERCVIGRYDAVVLPPINKFRMDDLKNISTGDEISGPSIKSSDAGQEPAADVPQSEKQPSVAMMNR